MVRASAATYPSPIDHASMDDRQRHGPTRIELDFGGTASLAVCVATQAGAWTAADPGGSRASGGGRRRDGRAAPKRETI